MILHHKKITVIGLGKSGFASAKFLAARGARVRVTDASQKKEVLESAGYLKSLGVRVETGTHSEIFLSDADLVVTSPGVSKKSFPLMYARKHRIPVISEVELASRFCPGRVIAVTGSNGKTTTCHLIYKIFQAAKKKSVLCGNVGYSFLDALPQVDAETTVILELSSFQLEDSPTFRPAVALVLNVSPNHLDRHGTLKDYARAKARIFQNQKGQDWLILNQDNALTKAMASSARSKVLRFSKSPLSTGVFATAEAICVKLQGKKTKTYSRASLRLKGDHNLENMMAAVAAATLSHIPEAVIRKTLEMFETLEHRIEALGDVGGVRFVNDSKSTTVDSTRAAIQAIDGPTILIAGGRDKGSDFREIERLLQDRIKEAVLYGEARAKISQAWTEFKRWTLEEHFETAVRLAFSKAVPGDTILLSPMCASFDQFSSFEERGERFKKIHHQLRAAWIR